MIPSPCIGLCRLDEVTDTCLGCARTRREIAGWGGMSDDRRDAVWAALPDRRARMGIAVHRLGWTSDDLHRFVRGTLRPGGGTWVGGVPGAVAEFCIGDDEDVAIEADGSRIRAWTGRAALAFDLHAEVRALAYDAGGAESIVVLAVPREQVALRPETVLTRVGPDSDAITKPGRDETLYDFGLGRAAGRFGVRTADRDLTAVLDAAVGMSWPEAMAACGPALVAASPTRVVRNPIGRIEVFTAIPTPGGRSPLGPHTHFLPEVLRLEGDTPPSLPIPDAYTLCAIHYPNAHAAARDTAPAEHHTALSP